MAKYWVYKILINLAFIGFLVYSLLQRNTLGLIILVTAAVICSILLILNDRVNRKDKKKEKQKEIS
ncbi:hypothetical protein [Halobacillus mangrovi]|uniref:Uncharacterized protein n=1 Tax=Halobacillus mangrovi TaxID=402384 RepID=A0A1W5ZQK7_9BACI|nr:hypothetical protein [Halobacillus mangrovi]ARI75580.1 hypothetical protein HM131_01515 [Halobacillus mangrovi]